MLDHAYDAEGNRVRTTVTDSPTVTDYLVDTSGALSHVVAEMDGAGQLAAYYVRGGDELLAVLRPDGAGGWTSRYYHADGIGSVRALTDEAGNVTDTYSYTAFGEQITHNGEDPQPYAFTGEPYDPTTGFRYHRARWMDPRIGRFAGIDRFPGAPLRVDTLHSYTYAVNDPVSMTDPSGFIPEPWQLAIGKHAHKLISLYYEALNAIVDQDNLALQVAQMVGIISLLAQLRAAEITAQVTLSVSLGGRF